MRPSPRWPMLVGLTLGTAMIAAACSTAAATPTATPAAPSAALPAAATSITLGSTNDANLGAYLTGQNGMTLYVLTTDPPDVSTCSGSCLTNWPPLLVASGATITPPSGAGATFATITLSDGTIEVTYNHKPLHYYAGDSVAGDTKGQGKNGVWFVAPLSGSLSGASPAATSPAASSTAASGY